MNLLVIGSGGREHAIAKKLKSSSIVRKVFCAKGNPLMTRDGIDVVDIDELDSERLIQFIKQNDISWVFVGPELPLFHGVSDALEAAGIQVFSPSKAAAKLEYSKDFAKQMMNKYHVPTAHSKTFSDFEQAKEYVLKSGAPIVIKADGLAAGKGVVVAMTIQEAIDALVFMLLDGAYTNEQEEPRVVIEEYLEGEEFSLFSLVSGEKAWFAGISQDHKRAFDGDEGPNTGGMGAYAPVPQFDQGVIDTAMDEVVYPIIKGLMNEGICYKGVLYAGLMMTKQGIKVIEFNARFGDPETQVVLQQLDSDLAQNITDILSDKEPSIIWNTNSISLGVVLAANGYPSSYEKNIVLPAFDDLPEGIQLYGAGITYKDDQWVSTGGRVVLLSAQAATIYQAREIVYKYLKSHQVEGIFYRSDIGHRGLS